MHLPWELDLALRVHSGMARAGADDTFVVGPPIAALEAVKLFVLSLKQNLGLSVNATKSQIFCQSAAARQQVAAWVEQECNRGPT